MWGPWALLGSRKPWGDDPRMVGGAGATAGGVCSANICEGVTEDGAWPGAPTDRHRHTDAGQSRLFDVWRSSQWQELDSMTIPCPLANAECHTKGHEGKGTFLKTGLF